MHISVHYTNIASGSRIALDIDSCLGNAISTVLIGVCSHLGNADSVVVVLNFSVAWGPKMGQTFLSSFQTIYFKTLLAFRD
jgi:hypothetical protein